MTEIELLERRYRLLGRGAPLFYDTPLHIVRGQGVWMYDAAGKAYLDAYNNVPVVGHCHPHVVEAIARQAATLNVHTRYLHETVLDYAQRLTGFFDETLDMAFFTCTGSEANDLALRMARTATGGMGIICSDNTYHGNSTAVDALSTMFREGRTGSRHVRAVAFPDAYRGMEGLQGAALADAYVRQVAEAIAAFRADGIALAGMLLCPIFANEGLPQAPDGYLARAAALVREAGGLVIFDEVQAGFGRTGAMWGQQLAGVVPDIVTLGKPMGNGHPLAGVVARGALVNAFRERVMYFNTFGGNPVACAAGMAVLDVLEQEKLVEHAASMGKRVFDGLRQLQSRHAAIGDVRGQGLFFAVELVSDRDRKTPDGAVARRVVNLMKEHGVLISRVGRHDNILKIRPPLPFGAGHCDQLLSTLDRCLALAGDAR